MGGERGFEGWWLVEYECVVVYSHNHDNIYAWNAQNTDGGCPFLMGVVGFWVIIQSELDYYEIWCVLNFVCAPNFQFYAN